MSKFRLVAVVVACAVSASAMAGQLPPYRPNIKPIQAGAPAGGPHITGTQPAPDLKPIQAKKGWSMVTSVPSG